MVKDTVPGGWSGDKRWFDEAANCWRDGAGNRVSKTSRLSAAGRVPVPPGVPESSKNAANDLALRRQVPEKQSRYLDWLVSFPDTRKPSSKVAMARELGVARSTLLAWEKRSEFRQEWKRRLEQVGHSPDKYAAVMQALFEAATDPDERNTQALSLWLKYHHMSSPPEVVESADNSLSPSDLSDEELDGLLSSLKDDAEREAGLRDGV